jgi:hypothetical protein
MSPACLIHPKKSYHEPAGLSDIEQPPYSLG